MWFRHGLKAQKLLAQGITLGISAIALRPVRAKALKNIRILRMKTREEYIALITSHAEELQNTFGITSLRLFGSVARSQHHDGSDVDIYVEMPPKFFLIVRLKSYLEALLCKGGFFEKKPQNLQKIYLIILYIIHLSK